MKSPFCSFVKLQQGVLLDEDHFNTERTGTSRKQLPLLFERSVNSNENWNEQAACSKVFF